MDTLGFQLFSRRTSVQGADVVFEVGEDETKEDICAHSTVLTARSSVMEAQLNGAFREASEKRIRVPDVLPCPFLGFLEVIYTGFARPLYDMPPCLARAATVRVTNVAASLAEWKEMMMRARVHDHLPTDGDGIMYTRSIKSSGKVEEVWLGFSKLEDAQAVVEKIGSEIGRAEIVGMRNPEFVCDIAVLLDRYAINDCVDWVVSQVTQYIGWNSDYLILVMCRAWSMSPGSVYRNAIVNMCYKLLNDQWSEEYERGDFTFTWEEFTGWLTRVTYPLPPMHAHTDLQVRLQLLRWANDLVIDFILHTERSIEDDDDFSSLRLMISDGIQSLIDRWSGNDQNEEWPMLKRRRKSA